MRRIGLVLLILLAAACSRHRGPATDEAREEEFRKIMTNATLVGKFSSNHSDKLAEDRYAISSVSKVAGGLWTINARIQYGSHDLTIPVPVRVLWASDTPILSLTDTSLPGLGTFTARIVIYRDQYAGMWSNDKGHGGQMFGRIEHGAPAAK